MTSYDSRPSGDSGYTPLEEELVRAMHGFAGAADVPRFDTDRVVRRSRRKRATAMAGGAAAVLLAIGGGTALATSVTRGPEPLNATSAATTGDRNHTTVLLGLPGGHSAPIRLAGNDETLAKAALAKGGLKIGFVKAACDGKPGSVIAVSPHAPTVVHKGDTVTVTLCAG
ncbi:hypothetical protein GCM10014715_86970 [Streptomyces spiralis]|uniref:PASTA domain-containing protein n=1 Tax=Streptomyces spiralis TaxID=66376 RepID=A0A919AQI8_9ACTN|nr:PASTA domain-containing protein [Streptomyces spiralis]GHF18656.1 hypothetical protein GCM10014715_86970 [Streptomyces spiralis]